MVKELIEINITHEPMMEEDNGFGVDVLINGKNMDFKDLTVDQYLHISSIILKASNVFINAAKKWIQKD